MTDTSDVLPRMLLDADERARVERLVASCNAHDGLDLKVVRTFLPGSSLAEHNAFLCYREDALVGYCALDGSGGDEIELCGMVDPAYRRQSIGHALLAAAGQEAQRRGIQHLLVICEAASTAGRAFVTTSGATLTFSEYRMALGRLRATRRQHRTLMVARGGLGDTAAIAHIVALAFGDAEPLVLARTEHDLPDPNQRFYVARLAGVPVASLKVYPFEQDAAGIYAFGVLPEYRGRGIGRQTLTEVCRQLQAEGRTRIALEVETTNATAHALYRACGFVERTTYGYYALELPRAAEVAVHAP